MTSSYNGWPASPNPDAIGVVDFRYAGAPFPSGVKGGDVTVVFRYLVNALATRVEDYNGGYGCWGYNYRANRNNPATLSCHSSGTAIDWRAPEHPNGRAGTFTAVQVGTIRTILSELGGVIRWGGDFSGTKDEMHFEINADAAAVHALANRLTSTAPTPPPAPTPTEDPVDAAQYATWKASDDGQRRDLREMANLLNKIAAKVGIPDRLDIVKGATNDGKIES